MRDNLFDRSFSNRLVALAAVEEGDSVALENSALEFDAYMRQVRHDFIRPSNCVHSRKCSIVLPWGSAGWRRFVRPMLTPYGFETLVGCGQQNRWSSSQRQ